jgi:peptidoglycan/xylan/chitin deacetylase (PgdA/CDA1 family)
MKTAARVTIDAALRWSPAQAYFRKRAALRLAVLAYHGVDDPGTFDRHLSYLARAATPVSLDEVVDAIAGRRLLPPRSVLVTFDDGHRSVLEYALPLLRERGIPAVAFVVAGLLDTDQPFWWTEVEHLVRAGATAEGHNGLTAGQWVRRLKAVPDVERVRTIEEFRRTARSPAPRQPQLHRSELAELESGGIAVENHTMTHPCLDRCDDDTVRAEVRDAHALLHAALGRPPRAFAYPNGNWDVRAERELMEEGYVAGFLFDHRMSARAPRNPLRISRLRVGTDTRLDRFAAILSGLHPAVHHARGGT